MSDVQAPLSSLLEWGIASASYPGEAVSGDSHVLCPIERGVLLGVVDGLGHGVAAAAAAAVAIATVEAHAKESLVAIIERCHRALAGTRGVVMGLARIEPMEHTLTWICVGNVQGAVVRCPPELAPRAETLLARPGIVGLRLPPLQGGSLPLRPGDAVVLATDGIQPQFIDHVVPGPPQPLARRLLEVFRKEVDDALVVVGRLREESFP